MLDRLEGSGHLTREQIPGDRRTTLVRLTEKNKVLKEKYEETSEEMRKIYYKGFTEDEVKRLNELLVRVLDNLIEYTKG